MKRTTVAIAVGALLIGGGTTAYAATSTRVPDAIKVPEGNKRIATYLGEGVQIYGCANGAWALIQPAATLSHRGRTIALHSKGPVWTSTVDGSTVGAAAVPGASSPRPNAVPELLLKANLNSGDGIFGKVTYVQRLDTRGGLAPAGTCATGTQTAVRYSADYAFWVAK
ncbi:DUF3455 domain-containing protein [Amycolatopsis umgeniensis]|uniref:Tat pathway signal sequence domain protein n=1 Tax=Amycolatopsis umgeniensis TaxID=336628 RepID=A0A841AVB3_9PSEU|nr:DUF3455 domain-containing protein [Amycolatopsis umgeniensis]MBB5851836.1 hypothetical protein [Amycolatopsis umgeniensis]